MCGWMCANVLQLNMSSVGDRSTFVGPCMSAYAKGNGVFGCALTNVGFVLNACGHCCAATFAERCFCQNRPVSCWRSSGIFPGAPQNVE